jgi:hypothetical protein
VEPTSPNDGAACGAVDLKRGAREVVAREVVARERAALSVALAPARARTLAPARVCATMAAAEARGASRVRSERDRASAVHGLAAAVAHGAARGVVLHVHAALVSVRRGHGTLYVGVAPDARFDAPEGACASWALGCVLYALITGEPLVPPRARTDLQRMREVMRYVGAPTLSECAALGLPVELSERRRARWRVRGARACELYVLASTLAYEPARRMRCTARGLVSALAPVYEQAAAMIDP